MPGSNASLWKNTEKRKKKARTDYDWETHTRYPFFTCLPLKGVFDMIVAVVPVLCRIKVVKNAVCDVIFFEGNDPGRYSAKGE